MTDQPLEDREDAPGQSDDLEVEQEDVAAAEEPEENLAEE
jgi:hypothetical protein